jgi:dTDP-4-dehydrorhamnose reductase
MRILVTGAHGQVGTCLVARLSPLGELVAATRDGRLETATPALAMDLARPDTLHAALDAARPDAIVNAAAYTAVDRAESEAELAHRVNAEAVGQLGQWAARHGVPVVHYSTDYVFPGDGNRPLREDDPTGPTGAYGRSKLAGEQALAASGAEHLVLRTAWVYAAHGHNFLRTMLRLGAERDQLAVVDDQHGTPTPADLIAEVTAQVLARWLAVDADTRRAQSGVYHLVASGQTTWCRFARAIFSRAVPAGLLAHAPRVDAITTAEFPTPARRPAWSVLDTTRLRATFGVELPSWEVGLDGVIAELVALR